MGRQQHRRVPVPPQLALLVVALRRVRLRLHLRVRQGPCDGPNPRPLPRRPVHAEQVAALRLGDHHVRVGRVHHREEAVARAHVVPVARANPLVRPGVRRRAPRTVVLQAAAHVIRVLHVHADLVELGDRQVAELVPVVGAVPAHRHAAVAAQDQVVRVRRVDPQRVVVQVHAGRRVGSEVAPSVGRPVHAGTAQVHALGVVGVHPYLAVIHGTIVGRAQVLPRLAPVGGAVDAVLALALGRPAAEPLPRRARIGFDQREDHVAVAPVDGQPDPPLVALRQSVGQLGPGVAAVGCAVDAAAGSAAVEAPGAPSALVRGREERARVRQVHDQVDGAGVVVDVQDLLPRVAAVGRAVDAPLRVGAPQVADRRHVRHVRVPGVDLNARDVVRVGQPQVRPRAPGVGGAVDAGAPRRALPVLRLARADPDDVGVRRRHRHVAHRGRRFVLEDVLEGDAGVLRLPHAAAGGADVEDARVRLDHGQVRHAPAHDRGTDRAELEGGGGAGEGVRGRVHGGLGRGRRRGGGRNGDQEAGDRKERERGRAGERWHDVSPMEAWWECCRRSTMGPTLPICTPEAVGGQGGNCRMEPLAESRVRICVHSTSQPRSSDDSRDQGLSPSAFQ